MRAVLFSLCVAAAASGCDALLKPKADNPVMGPPPPRVTQHEPAARSSLDPSNPLYPQSAMADTQPKTSGGPIQEISYEGDKPLITDNTVVATVNGTPIFAAQVLEQYAPKLAEISEKVSAHELNEGKLTIIRRDLNLHIERKLLSEALKGTLASDQVEMLEGHIDELFEQEIEHMKERTGVKTRLELEAKAEEQGTSLAQLRDAFASQLMAKEFLRAKAGTPPQIGRPEMLAYYKEHLDEYSFPLQVLWQQIVVDHDKHGGKRQALEHLEKAVSELRNAADFGEVAKRYSDGPRAAQGGQWDWTRTGSLADSDVEDVLFRLSPGTISSVIEGDNAFKLVKVVQRREAGHTPFEEVQDEIKKKIQQQFQQDTMKDVLADMQERAVIWSIFDEPE